MLPAFSCILWACAFGAGCGASIYFSELVEAGRDTYVAASAGWFFCNPMVRPFIGEQDSASPPRWLELQRASSFRTRVRSRPGLNGDLSFCASYLYCWR
jgi:hypothetical protein